MISRVSAAHGQCDVFGDGHLGRGSGKGILKDAADIFRAAILRPAGDVGSIDAHRSLIRQKTPGHRIEQCAFAGSVRSDNRRETAFGQIEINSLQGPHLVRGAREKRFLHIPYFKHDAVSSGCASVSRRAI